MAAEALAQKTNVPEIQDAIVRIRTLSADERARELAYQRELALHEKATWEENLREAEEKTRKAEEKTKKAEEKTKEAEEKTKKAEERAEKAEKKSAALIEVLKAEGYTEERIAEILGK